MKRAMQMPAGRSWLLAAGLLAAVVGCLALASPARGGSYVVTQCSPSNPSAGQASWELSTANYQPRSRCGVDDGGLQSFHNAEQSGLFHFGAWVWRAPAGTVFTSIQANASLTNQAGHQGQLVATRPGGELAVFGAEHPDFRVHQLDGEFTQFHSWLRCLAPGPGRPCGRAAGDSAHAYVRGVFLKTDDRAAPALALTGGSLLGSPVVRGVRGLTFAASDQGGGIRKVYAEANGSTVVTDIRNCAVIDGFATALSPCPAATTESLAVPTASPAFATGPNTVTACAEDLALDGFANRACQQRHVWVDNACPASTVAGGVQLSAGFGGDGAETVLVRSDRPGVIRGRVLGAGSGATVCALTRVLVAGQPIVVGATATTAADGSYAIELPPGAGREVFVHYVIGDGVVARHGLTLRSSVRPTLAVEPNHGVRNHDRLYFSGTLPGPACFDRLVKVQARLGKHRWQVFRTDRSDESCAFGARYKLRATRTARRYRFRALVPQQAGYPFERGYSATAKVKIKRRRR